MKRGLILFVLLLVLAACQPVPATEAPATPTRKIETKEDTPGENIVVGYWVSGGFAGFTETWFIYDGGRVVGGQQGEMYIYQVTEEEVQGLLKEIDSLGFWELEETGPKSLAQNGADRIVRSLAVYQGDQSKGVQIMDGADDQSPLLMEIMTAVQRFIDRAIEE